MRDDRQTPSFASSGQNFAQSHAATEGYLTNQSGLLGTADAVKPIVTRALPDRVLRISTSVLARNTIWMMMAQGAGLMFQGVYFVVIARVLGVAGLGVFAAGLALVSLATPFAGWGTANILVREVAREPALFPVYWGNALATTLLSGIFFTMLSAGFALLFLPSIPSRLILCVGGAELICAAIIHSCEKSFVAFKRLGGTAQLNLLLSGTRLMMVLKFASLAKPSPLLWAFYYLAASAAAMIAGLTYTALRLGRPQLRLSVIPRSLGDGWYFALGLAAQTIYNDLDKTMLASISTVEAVGIYSAAYRILRVAFSPVSALLSSTYSLFFRHGANGIRGSLAFAKHVLPFAASYGFVAWTGLFLLAPIVPDLLGQQFRASVDALRWLSVIPLLQSFHYFAADTLTGADAQRLRSIIQVGVAVFNFTVNLWLIPVYSWRGAAWSSIASDGALAVGLWVAVFVLNHKRAGVKDSYSSVWRVATNDK